MFKRNKAVLLLASAALLLSSCEVIAYPEGYNSNKLVNQAGDDDRYNLESIIYDALHGTSNANTIVVNLVFDKIFDSYFGTYEEIEAAVRNNSYNEIVNAHKAYQDSEHADGAAASTTEKARVDRVFNRFQTKISESLWEDISSTSYQNSEGLFEEEKFALHVYQSLYSLDPTSSGVTWSTFTASNTFYGEIQLLPDTDLYDEETKTWADQSIIHISDSGKLSGQNDFGYYKEYIEKEYLSDIKQHVLTEYYIYTQQYESLGTRYARKINYVSISDNTNFSGNARKLAQAFIDTYITNGSSASNVDFSLLDRVWVGLDLTDEEEGFLDSAGIPYQYIDLNIKESDDEDANYANFQALNEDERVEFDSLYGENYTKTDGEESRGVKYYEGTSFGDLLLNFNKIKDDIALTDSTQESNFSGSNAYSYYKGFTNSVKDLRETDNTVDGWGVKNDSFTTLNGITDYGDRLWNIQVANGLITEGGNSYVQEVTFADGTSSYYLLPKTLQQTEAYPYLYYSGGTYYIVQVEEAASTTRLSQSDVDGSYISLGATTEEGELKREAVAYEICNIVADDDAQQTTALEYYLEEAEFIYHDDSIYEYFEATYPDLFD